MDAKTEKNLILRISEYGLNHDRFTLTKLYQTLKLSEYEIKYVVNTLISDTSNETSNPNHILVTVDEIEYEPESELLKYQNIGMGLTLKQPKQIVSRLPYYSLTPTALFNYIDYLEIVEARKAAQQARTQAETATRLAIASILIGLVLGLGQIFISIFR